MINSALVAFTTTAVVVVSSSSSSVGAVDSVEVDGTEAVVKDAVTAAISPAVLMHRIIILLKTR